MAWISNGLAGIRPDGPYSDMVLPFSVSLDMIVVSGLTAGRNLPGTNRHGGRYISANLLVPFCYFGLCRSDLDRRGMVERVRGKRRGELHNWDEGWSE